MKLSRGLLQLPRQWCGQRFLVSHLSAQVFWMAFALTLVTKPSGVSGADHLVLRNLQLLDNVEVLGFDEDGIKLQDGRQWTWDQIVSGKVSDDQQQEFNDLLSKLSLPLYRLDWRLRLGNDSDLLTCVDPLLETYGNRISLAAAKVWYGELRGRLAQGQRAAALIPLLKIDRIIRSGTVSSATLQDVLSSGDNRNWSDPTTGICMQLLPVWFDQAEAEEHWKATFETYSALQAPSTTATLYVSSLAVAAGQNSTSLELLQAIDSPSQGQQQWVDLIRFEMERLENGTQNREAQVAGSIHQYSRPLQAIAYYALGCSRIEKTQETTIQKGQLDLLKIPAELDDVAEEVASAALSRVASSLESTNHPREAGILWNELNSRYPASWHSQQRRAP